MGVYARYFIRPLKIACLHSLRSWAIYFAFTRLRLAGKMIIYARLRLRKKIFFRGLIKYLAHNHPHATTIVLSTLLSLFTIRHLMTLFESFSRPGPDALQNGSNKVPYYNMSSLFNNLNK